MPQGCARPLSAEGLKKLFSGATMASSRGALVTVGQVGWWGQGLGQCMAQQGGMCTNSLSLQLSCYDQAKQLVLTTGLLSDNIFTHFLASFIAVSRAGDSAGDGAVCSWAQGSGLRVVLQGSDGAQRLLCRSLLWVIARSHHPAWQSHDPGASRRVDVPHSCASPWMC